MMFIALPIIALTVYGIFTKFLPFEERQVTYVRLVD